MVESRQWDKAEIESLGFEGNLLNRIDLSRDSPKTSN